MMPMPMMQKPQTSAPMVAGILLMIAGIIWIVEAALVLAAAFTLGNLGIPGLPIDLMGMMGPLQGLLAGLGIVGIILAIIVILGGYFSTQRTHLPLAIIGGVFGLAAIGPLGIASLLSLIALILAAISHEEYR